MEALVEQFLSSLHFPKMHPIALSQQLESYLYNSRKVSYIQGSQPCTSVGYSQKWDKKIHVVAPAWDFDKNLIQPNFVSGA